jgi:hypothetical protein
MMMKSSCHSTDALAEVEPEVHENDVWDFDLSLSTDANVIAESTLPTGAHILESQDIIGIANIGATSHVIKHAGGGKKHHQTSVKTHGFAVETIKPNCEMDIPVLFLTRKEQRSLTLYSVTCKRMRCSTSIYLV